MIEGLVHVGRWRRSRPSSCCASSAPRPAGSGLTTVALLGDVMLGRSAAERLSAGVWSEELVALCRGRDASWPTWSAASPTAARRPR